jgi:hypothetical protein
MELEALSWRDQGTKSTAGYKLRKKGQARSPGLEPSITEAVQPFCSRKEPVNGLEVSILQKHICIFAD